MGLLHSSESKPRLLVTQLCRGWLVPALPPPPTVSRKLPPGSPNPPLFRTWAQSAVLLSHCRPTCCPGSFRVKLAQCSSARLDGSGSPFFPICALPVAPQSPDTAPPSPSRLQPCGSEATLNINGAAPGTTVTSITAW